MLVEAINNEFLTGIDRVKRVRIPKYGLLQRAYDLAREYVQKIVMAARNEPEPWFIPTQDRSVINLEHILPKKPEGNWPQFTDDEAAMYVNRLGNQALLRASNNSDVRSAGWRSSASTNSRRTF